MINNSFKIKLTEVIETKIEQRKEQEKLAAEQQRAKERMEQKIVGDNSDKTPRTARNPFNNK